MSDVGSVAGGWLAGWLMRRGSRRRAPGSAVMLAAALLALSALLTARTTSLWGVVALVGLGTAAHQAWSANVYSLASDLFPRAAVGRVVGLAGMAGSLGASCSTPSRGTWWPGRAVTRRCSRSPSAYLVAWCALRALLRPARSRFVAG